MKLQFIRNLGKNILVQILSFAVIVAGVGIVYAAWSTIDRNTAATGLPVTSVMMQGIIDRVNDATVPAGAVMAFNLATCPTGWSLADGAGGRPDLRGEFIRGLDNGRGVDVGRTLGSPQVDAFRSHAHTFNMVSRMTSAISTSFLSAEGAESGYAVQSTPSTSSSGGVETRPRNVAFNYCIKN